MKQQAAAAFAAAAAHVVDAKIGDGMDIAIHGENGEEPRRAESISDDIKMT